ncbi:MAG: MBL fold metallo-hydrolase, partial [Clostridia bacterium]|nr:MBL fold metallo-hydrolase [Clostridia bacterium]
KQRILSNHGHLSNDNAAVLATHLAQKGTKHIYLGHLSHENNAPEIAFEATKSALIKCGFDVDKDVHVCVASRDRFSEVTQI